MFSYPRRPARPVCGAVLYGQYETFVGAFAPSDRLQHHSGGIAQSRRGLFGRIIPRSRGLYVRRCNHRLLRGQPAGEIYSRSPRYADSFPDSRRRGCSCVRADYRASRASAERGLFGDRHAGVRGNHSDGVELPAAGKGVWRAAGAVGENLFRLAVCRLFRRIDFHAVYCAKLYPQQARPGDYRDPRQRDCRARFGHQRDVL